jgi:hypothetical protein
MVEMGRFGPVVHQAVSVRSGIFLLGAAKQVTVGRVIADFTSTC